jgi:hypothetical protein
MQSLSVCASINAKENEKIFNLFLKTRTTKKFHRIDKNLQMMRLIRYQKSKRKNQNY